ncbi:MAG TPA: RdgB/HAM1 family non-canonical purine NTP pyrophosphatase [Rudaea sp.]|nr:RdgB/HAM1 family non-canonical purine NTP pyrophosphatase [Rudaea sp.]
MKIVLASGNAGKLVEMREILGGEFELVAQRDLKIADVDETGATFVENAILKARNAARLSGLPALGDDSGLCVDALSGAPGLYSARYAGAHGDAKANIAKLLEALRDEPDRNAYFYCCVVLLRHADDPAPIIGEGRWFGRILDAPRGERGFGYDPIFFDPKLDAGAGELDASAKNRVSHRGQALASLRAQLKR